MIGTGEYTTGYGQWSNNSDKKAGVVGIVMFDLRKRGRVNRVGLCGVNGKKLPDVRAHMKKAIADTYTGFDISCGKTMLDGVRFEILVTICAHFFF